MDKKVWERECPICNRIIKGGGASLTSFEEMFERHLRTHKLLSFNYFRLNPLRRIQNDVNE